MAQLYIYSTEKQNQKETHDMSLYFFISYLNLEWMITSVLDMLQLSYT